MAEDESHAHPHVQSHAHAHGHTHEHSAQPAGSRFAIGAGVNLAFVAAEIIFGVASHSVALVADAAHNFGDVLGLLLAWGATVLARRIPSSTHTYGLRKTTLLAALANAVLLLMAVGGVVWEAVQRLANPEPVNAPMVMAVAAIGAVVNASSAMLFLKDRHHDANVETAFAHLAADALIAVCVVGAGLVVWLTGWRWIDPVTSLAVSAAVVAMTWALLRDSLGSMVDAVPAHVDYRLVREYLAQLPNVSEVHDLHIWRLSSTETALTAHLILPWSECPPSFLTGVCKELHDRFDIEHATLQIESPEAVHPCAQAADDAV